MTDKLLTDLEWMKHHPPRTREVSVGNAESFICAGFRRTRNYSPRTLVHWHVWLMVGPLGGALEWPRANR